MWKSLLCLFTGRHAYEVTCEPGHIFLRCRACGRQTTGWGLHEERTTASQRAAVPVRADRHQAAVRIPREAA